MFILPSIGMFHFEPLNVLLNFWLQYEPSYMVVNYQYKKTKNHTGNTRGIIPSTLLELRKVILGERNLGTYFVHLYYSVV